VIDLTGKVAVITGAAGGIGSVTAKLFATLGASVVIADINADGAKQVADEIIAADGIAVPCPVDLRIEDQVHAMIEMAVHTFGGLDVLHNNAASMAYEVIGNDTDVESMTLDIWEETVNVSLRATMLGCKYAVPVMRSRGGGSIINTASTSGLTGELVRPAYGAAKAGIIGLTRNVATRYGHENIRCNAIAPGIIMTPPSLSLPEDYKRRSRAARLIKRDGQPEDIAAMAAFLASDASGYITGQVFPVDGGYLVHHPMYEGGLALLLADEGSGRAG
jgi:NAD(P)-dependent dehydrogenase (short-subunit alcohol dehydrogenase family)